MNCGSASNIEQMKGVFKNDPKIIVPILSDTKAHWCVNRLSFAYVFNIHTHSELMLGFNHNDIYRFDPSILGDFVHDNCFVYKKKYLYDFRHKDNVFDVEMLYWYNTNQRFNLDAGPVIRRYWTDFKEYPNVNDFIPIMKQLEYCRNIKDKLLNQITDFNITEPLRRYQNIADNLVEIEINGLYVDTTK